MIRSDYSQGFRSIDEYKLENVIGDEEPDVIEENIDSECQSL